MTRRMTAWLAAALLTVGSLALWGAFTALMHENRNLTQQLEIERQRNFMELTGRMQNIQSLLAKGLAAGSVAQNMYQMGEVYRQATAAASNFMALPMPGPLSASTGKFLNQVGDFAYSVARNEAAGRPMQEEARSELRRLQAEAAALARQMEQVGDEAARTGFRWTGAPPRLADLFVRRLPGSPGQNQAPTSLLPGGLDEIGPQMDQLPVLAYDGPFSDHLTERAPSLGGAPLTPDEARTRAIRFIPDGTMYAMVDSAEVDSQVPAWSFRFAPAAAAEGARPTDYTLTVEVTQAGGHLLLLLNGRMAGEPSLSLEQAKEIGLEYLHAHGFAPMTPTFGEAADGFATVQYAVRQSGVLVYPDQVKLRIALDSGEVVGVDAWQYIMNHRERGALPQPAVTREQAALALNPSLVAERVQLALIPTEAGDGEVLAYEFLARLGEETFLVYVNAVTGHEERILQMILTANGTLAL